MILEERAARLEAEAVAARAQAVNSNTEALIAHLKLAIEKLRRESSTGRARSTRRDCWIRWSFNSKIWRRTAATEDELAAENAASQTPTVKSVPAQAALRAGRSPIIYRVSAW